MGMWACEVIGSIRVVDFKRASRSLLSPPDLDALGAREVTVRVQKSAHHRRGLLG
jgi:hypothetical protein